MLIIQTMFRIKVWKYAICTQKEEIKIMEYTFVATRLPPENQAIDTDRLVAPFVKNRLFSLIGGLRQKGFGYDTLYGMAEEIRRYHRRYGGTLYVDSGGFSIIKGDVNPMDVVKSIDCYCEYLKTGAFDYIFSLDIPLNLKFSSFNTRENIYRFNKLSLQRSMEWISESFYFVWHFKIAEQFEIWTRLYDELGLRALVTHHALGGMVSIRAIVKIDFSPFIGMAFWCLFHTEVLRLHFLGVNIRYDRFQIIFLEKLFRYYRGKEVAMTYDSIHYARAAQLKLKSLPVFYFQQGRLERYDNILSTPGDLIRRIYDGEEIFSEINRLKAGAPLNNVDAFTALNIYSEISLDRYFDHIIEKYKFREILTNSKNSIRFGHDLEKVFSELKKEPVFTGSMIRSIRNNMEITYRFHRWFTERGDPEGLVRAFHAKINFPYRLK